MSVAGLAGYVAWDRVEAHWLVSAVAAIAARGEPIDLSEREQPPPTPQHEEAARLYAEAAQRAREMTQQDGKLTRTDVDGAPGRVNVAEIESTFRKDAPALQLLDRAAPLPFAGFGEAIDGPEWSSAQGLQSLRALACLRADLLAYRGDGDAAAASLAAAVRVQRTLRELFYVNVIAVRQIGSLRILLRHSSPSGRALETLQGAFAETPDDDLIERDLQLRRALLIESRGDSMGDSGQPAAAVFVFHPFLVRSLRVQIEQYSEVLLASRAPWPDKLGILSALAEAQIRRDGRTSLGRVIFGPPVNIAALSAAPAIAGMRLASRRLALTKLAIERYRRVHNGEPPAGLAALVPAFMSVVPLDPFSGRPLVYKASRVDYLLYSLDVNRKDDGGEIYGIGSLNPMPAPRVRDFGIRVPLSARRATQ